MRKSLRIMSLFVVLTTVLSGCINNLDDQTKEEESLAPDEVTVQTTNNQISDQYYRAVITDGKYKLAASASANTNLHSSKNIKGFEEGLMRISKSIFPTDQYFLQEGQLIDEATMTSWVGRESEDNSEGLNPALPNNEEVEEVDSSESRDPADDPENGDESQESDESGESQEETASADENQTVVDSPIPPIYLNQIMEKNIMVEEGDSYRLAGVVLGLSMNSEYQYTDSHGTVYKEEISVGEMRERGKQYANIIVGRLRNTEELRSVPIVVGIYSSAPNEDNIAGTYVMDGISREGNSVSDWAEHNEYRVALPALDEDSQSDKYTYFDNFSNDIRNFFPNLNGISGDALYINDGLAQLNIEIVSQFFQETEITALTQYVNDVASRQLPEGVPIEIKISSVSGVEAYLTRSGDKGQFQVHIFN